MTYRCWTNMVVNKPPKNILIICTLLTTIFVGNAVDFEVCRSSSFSLTKKEIMSGGEEKGKNWQCSYCGFGRCALNLAFMFCMIWGYWSRTWDTNWLNIWIMCNTLMKSTSESVPSVCARQELGGVNENKIHITHSCWCSSLMWNKSIKIFQPSGFWQDVLRHVTGSVVILSENVSLFCFFFTLCSVLNGSYLTVCSSPI